MSLSPIGGGPAATPQLRELDELSSSIFCLVEPYLEMLGDRHGSRQKGLSCDDIAAILLPYLYHEAVPLDDRFRREWDVYHAVAKVFREATVNRPHTLIFWDPFIEFLAEGHRRNMLRLSQRPFPSFSFLPARCDALPLGIRQACAIASADLHATVLMRDCHQRRVMEYYDDRQWTLLQGPTDVVQSALFGMPVAMASIPAPFHHVAVCTTSSSGSALAFLDRAGRVSHEVPVQTHFSCMRWMPKLNRLVCGSILGEITEWLPSGKLGPTTVQPHNGPIVVLDHMQILDAIVSVGTDGRVAVTDAHTITEIVRGVITKDHVTCGAFHTEMNMVAVGGTSTHLTFSSASLAHQRLGNVLNDTKNPHRHIVTDVRFVHDALLSLDAGGTVKVWDVRTARCMDTIHAPLTDEQRRTSPFSRMFPLTPSEATSNASVGIVGDSVTLLLGPDKSKSAQFAVRAEDELVRFVDVAKHGVGAVLVTATQFRIRLWSCRNGELLGEVTSTSDRICALTAFDAAHSILFATCRGEVRVVGLDDVLAGNGTTAARLWTTLPASSGACDLLAICYPLVLCCTPTATFLLDGRHAQTPGRQALCVEGIRACRRAEVFSDLSAVGLLSTDAKLFVVEPVETDAGVDVEDFREYNLIPALRYADEPFFAHFCFLGSPTLVCTSDGPDITVILLSSIRCRRLLSFSSVAAPVVAFAFESANMRSVLVTAEADGGCAVYVMNEFLDKLAAGTFAQRSIDQSVAPQLHLSFTAPFANTMSLLPFLSVAFCSSMDGSCALFRFDGVKVGDLDQFQSGTASRWLPLSTKTRRGSNIVFRNKFDVEKSLNDGLHCRHGTRLHSHSPAPSDGSILEQLRDPLASLPFKQRLKAVTAQGLSGASPSRTPSVVEPAPAVVKIRGERSSRTLHPIELASSKWTVDDKKEVPVRDGKKVMMGVRLLTVGLLPSPELVKETKRILAPLSPSKSHPAAQGPSRSLALKPLHVKPATPLFATKPITSLEVQGVELPLAMPRLRSECDVDGNGDEEEEAPQNFFIV